MHLLEIHQVNFASRLHRRDDFNGGQAPKNGAANLRPLRIALPRWLYCAPLSISLRCSFKDRVWPINTHASTTKHSRMKLLQVATVAEAKQISIVSDDYSFAQNCSQNVLSRLRSIKANGATLVSEKDKCRSCPRAAGQTSSNPPLLERRNTCAFITLVYSADSTAVFRTLGAR